MTEIVQLSRRNFLKLSGAAAAAAGLTGTGVKTAFAQESGGLTYDTIVPTLCEQCVWRCGVLAKIKDGKITNWTAIRTTPTPTACCARAARAAS